MSKFTVVVSVIIVNNDCKFLLAKRSKKENVLPGYWGVPGGKVEATNQTSNALESEAAREVREEIGVEIKDITYLESHIIRSDHLHVYFTARIAEGIPHPNEDTEQVSWFTVTEAKNLKLTPHTYENIVLASNRFLKKKI